MNRRTFLLASASAGALKAAPQIGQIAKSPAGKRILTLVYDRSIGAMRAIDRVVP